MPLTQLQHRARLTAQLLAGEPARTPVEVADRLLAVQAQDPRGFRLAVRGRSTGLTTADVDRALTADRSLVVSWLNRGTLHLVRSEDYWWLHPLTTPQLATGNRRRLGEEGVPPGDAERAVTAVTRALENDGPLTREALREAITAVGVRTEGQALVHILFAATLRGLVVRGPVAGPVAGPVVGASAGEAAGEAPEAGGATRGEQAFVLVRDWLGTPPPLPVRDSALAALARRYLAGHGPASDRDLARWANIGLRDARRGLSAIGGELSERPDGLAQLSGGPDPAPLPPPRLLGAYDPLLLGWVDRSPVVGPHRRRVTVNGLFRAFALVDGRATAVWRLAGGRPQLEPLEPMPAAVEAALSADADAVQRFLTATPPVGDRGSGTQS